MRGRYRIGVFAPECKHGPDRDRRGVTDGTGRPVTSYTRVSVSPRSHPARPRVMLGDRTMGSKRKQTLRVVHPHCAGIDVGKAKHYVAVPEGADERPVRSFASFTDELRAMAAWLKSCGVDTVAMEVTGVYWIPVFEVLDRSHEGSPAKGRAGGMPSTAECFPTWTRSGTGRGSPAFSQACATSSRNSASSLRFRCRSSTIGVVLAQIRAGIR